MTKPEKSHSGILVSGLILVSGFWFLISAPAARADIAPTQGLSGLDENALYAELADRGLDDLLNRVMDQDNVAPQQRSAIASISALHRLQTETNLSDDQRQALLQTVVGGLDQILATLHSDPELILQQAKIVAQLGVDPQTGLLEYWGATPIERNRLLPLAQAALKLYDTASQLASQQATDLANRITSPDDKLADQWKKASETAAAADYQKARMQYAVALAMDPGDPARQDLIDQALKSFRQWDNGDSQIQSQVRLLMAKLHVLTGDKDEISDGQKLLDSIINDRNGDISPPPAPEAIFEARCFSVIASLGADDLASARTALESASKYQQENFPDDRDQAAALRLLAFRILAMQADELPVGKDRDAANAAAVTALAGLVRDFPNLRDAIFRQLVARLPANPDLPTLDPMLLLALVDQGRQTLATSGTGRSPDPEKLRQAAAAAQEILNRLSAGNFPKAEAIDSSFLLGIFQEYLGDDAAAVTSLLDHIERFPGDPRSHADIALERARSLIANLLQANAQDPQVKQLEDRFLPVAVNPPFNRKEFALQYAALLFEEGKWADAIRYYQMTPDSEPPSRLLVARYGEMVALKNLLEETPSLTDQQKQDWTDQIQQLAQSVTTLANDVINGSGAADEKSRAKTTLARMSLIAADITRREQNNPRRVLRLLNGFEDSVKGLPDEKSLLNGAMFLRIEAYMQLGQSNDATQTLLKYLNTATPKEGAQAVHDLLETLSAQLQQAKVAGNQTQIRQISDNRAMLSGFLVKWAWQSTDPNAHANLYIYRRFDADSKRLAAESDTDAAQRQKDLFVAIALYKALQLPDSVALYQAGLDAGADKDYPDPEVTLGIGLIAYDLGDCHTVKDTLGRLIQDEKLGEDNDQYWEAAFKLLDCMHTLAKSGDPNTTEAQVEQSLKVLYLIWRDEVGGSKYHQKFETLRQQVLPNWKIPTSPAS